MSRATYMLSITSHHLELDPRAWRYVLHTILRHLRSLVSFLWRWRQLLLEPSFEALASTLRQRSLIFCVRLSFHISSIRGIWRWPTSEHVVSAGVNATSQCCLQAQGQNSRLTLCLRRSAIDTHLRRHELPAQGRCQTFADLQLRRARDYCDVERKIRSTSCQDSLV